MNKAYVVYEVRQEDYVLINNYQVDFECIKVFKDEMVAMNWFLENLKEQCSLIEFKDNGKSIYGLDDDEKHEWVARVEEKNNIKIAEVYYCDEWQYTMYLKEMEVE